MKAPMLLVPALGFVLGFSPVLQAQDDVQTVGVHRFALLIGANDGGPERVQLRYASDDAIALGQVLEEIGGVAAEDQILLTDPSRADLEEGLFELTKMVEAAEGAHARTEVVFYYSGHSDEQGLRLGQDLYPYPEFKAAIFDVPADVRLAILDSCASGTMTRTKGGKFKAPFLIDDASSVTGYAILTSSSADEAAQESDRIGASFFTHSLVSGLRGAADTTGDSRVTLNEVYNFAFNDTLARTEKTQVGAQHPAYDIQLAGTGDLVLTDLRETSATLVLGPDLGGRVFVRDEDGRLVVEVRKLQGQSMSLALEPGVYDITLQVDDGLKGGQVAMVHGDSIGLNPEAFRPIEGEVNRVRGDTQPQPKPKSTTLEIQGRDGQPRVKVDITLDPSRLIERWGPMMGLPGVHGGGVQGESAWEELGEEVDPGYGTSIEAYESTLKAYEANQDALEANRRAYEATLEAYEDTVNAELDAQERQAHEEAPHLDEDDDEELIASIPGGYSSHESYEYDGGDARAISVGVAPRVHALNGIQVGLFAARVHGPAQGLQLSLFNNSVLGPMEGLQANTLSNTIMGPLEGLQLAGLVNNVHGPVEGMQAAGLVNNVSGPMEGVQAAGLVNSASGAISGLQAAGLVNNAYGPMEGVQAAGLVNRAAGGGEGLQAAGLVNVTQGPMEGVQAAGLINVAKGDVEGVQAAGLINIAERVDGMQLGLINVSKHIDGLPLGLINIVEDGERRLSIYETDLGMTHVGFNLGSHRVYSQLNFGWDPTSGRERFAYGAGVGLHYGGRLWMNVDALAHQLVEPGAALGSLHMLNQARLLFGIQVLRRVGFFIGPTFNVLVSNSENETASTKIPDALHATVNGDPVNVFMWPGLQMGIQLL